MRDRRAHTLPTDWAPRASVAGWRPLRDGAAHAPEGVFLHVK